MYNRVSPEVDRVIKPIIMEMTQIDIAQQNAAEYRMTNEPDSVKRAKRRCVHITFNGNDFVIRVRKQEDGTLKCPVCNQEIGHDFTEEAVQDYFRCLKRVNQLLFFGMLKGMVAGPIQACIMLKEMLPDAAKMHKEMNIFVSKDNKQNNALENLGKEYETSNVQRNITGFYGGGIY